MSSFRTPTTKTTSNMLEMLFGDNLEMKDAALPDLSESVIGTYIDDTDNLVGACIVDFNFAAYAGAAMSGLPKGAADDAIAANQLTDVMIANLSEVMNIMTRLLMDDSSSHLRFQKVLLPGSDAAAAEALQSLQAVAFAVDIPRYGAGCLGFLHQ